MEKLRENVPRYQALAIPRERFNQNENFDPYKVKRGALSYRISNSVSTLAKAKRASFDNEPMDYLASRASYLRPIENSGRDANALTNRRRNQLDLDTYAQMVKRGPLSYRVPDFLTKSIRPRKTSNVEEPSWDHSLPGVRNVQSIFEGGSNVKAPTTRLRNRLDLDAYAQMVANNDKQCPSRIKKLAKPRRSYLDYNDFCANIEYDSFCDDLNGI